MKIKTADKAYTETVKRRIRDYGADLVGIADTAPLGELPLQPATLLDSFPRAISMALCLPKAIFRQIEDRPTAIYAHAYKTANMMLDEMAFRAASSLEREGFSALAVPASQVLDRERWLAAISHKAVAKMAGIGWQGKSLLLVTPEFGPRVRLVTVLTDAPLAVDDPLKSRCGTCDQCKQACPAGAIKGTPSEERYASREDAVDIGRCAGKLVNEFSKMPEIGASICGLCIKACPFSRIEKKAA